VAVNRDRQDTTRPEPARWGRARGGTPRIAAITKRGLVTPHVDCHRLAAGDRGQCRAAAASAAATATAAAEDRCRVPERLPVLGRLLRARTEHQVQDDAEAYVDLPGRLHGVVRLLRRDQLPESIDLRLSAWPQQQLQRAQQLIALDGLAPRRGRRQTASMSCRARKELAHLWRRPHFRNSLIYKCDLGARSVWHSAIGQRGVG